MMAGVVHSYLGAKIKDRIKGRKDGKGIEEEEKNKKISSLRQVFQDPCAFLAGRETLYLLHQENEAFFEIGQVILPLKSNDACFLIL